MTVWDKSPHCTIRVQGQKGSSQLSPMGFPSSCMVPTLAHSRPSLQALLTLTPSLPRTYPPSPSLPLSFPLFPFAAPVELCYLLAFDEEKSMCGGQTGEQNLDLQKATTGVLVL